MNMQMNKYALECIFMRVYSVYIYAVFMYIYATSELCEDLEIF